MKISDLPPKSEAVKALRLLTPDARRERLRCAQEAVWLAVFCRKHYPDQPAQWIRCEAILRGILEDPYCRLDWWERKR